MQSEIFYLHHFARYELLKKSRKHTFLCKIIYNNYFIVLWYLLKLSDPFIKNENSVLPILIQINFEQKIYFCLLKMRCIFLIEEKSNFCYLTWTEITKIIFSTSCRNSRFFLSYFLKKEDLPKVYAGSRLPVLPYIHLPVFLHMNFMLKYWPYSFVFSYRLKFIHIQQEVNDYSVKYL